MRYLCMACTYEDKIVVINARSISLRNFFSQLVVLSGKHLHNRDFLVTYPRELWLVPFLMGGVFVRPFSIQSPLTLAKIFVWNRFWGIAMYNECYPEHSNWWLRNISLQLIIALKLLIAALYRQGLICAQKNEHWVFSSSLIRFEKRYIQK